MKISSVILAGCLLCATSAFAATQTVKTKWYGGNHLTADLSFVTLNENIHDIKSFSNVDLGYKASLKDDVTKVFYGEINAIKYQGSHIGYGVMAGAHQSAGLFRPFMEVSYQHSPGYEKLFTKNQFGYDGGVEVHYFKRLSAYAKYYDFADNDSRAIIMGTSFDINSKVSVFANYHFKAKDVGTSAEFGVGYKFS